MLKKNKNLLSILFVILMIALTGVTFAYWDSLSDIDGVNLQISNGAKLTIKDSVNSDDGKSLIPIGAILGENDVDIITKVYNLSLNKNVVSPLKLKVDISDVKVGGQHYEGLVNFEIIKSEYFDVDIPVIVKISLANIDINYQEIYNKKITYTITFSLE